jgi:hypothetical protein
VSLSNLQFALKAPRSTANFGFGTLGTRSASVALSLNLMSATLLAIVDEVIE